jgi:hypothetical protein
MYGAFAIAGRRELQQAGSALRGGAGPAAAPLALAPLADRARAAREIERRVDQPDVREGLRKVAGIRLPRTSYSSASRPTSLRSAGRSNSARVVPALKDQGVGEPEAAGEEIAFSRGRPSTYACCGSEDVKISTVMALDCASSDDVDPRGRNPVIGISNRLTSSCSSRGSERNPGQL